MGTVKILAKLTKKDSSVIEVNWQIFGLATPRDYLKKDQEQRFGIKVFKNRDHLKIHNRHRQKKLIPVNFTGQYHQS